METKKSFWAELTFLKILFFWLILPIIWALLVSHNYSVTADTKSITVKEGVFNISTTQYALPGITQVNVYRPFFGRIFKYGTVTITLAGDKELTLKGIKEPDKLKEYIQSILYKTSNSDHVIVN